MNREGLNTLLERIAPLVRDEMLKIAAPNCCIATVAVLRAVFAHFGFDATGVPVQVVISNAKMLRAVRDGMLIPQKGRELAKWMEATGAWRLGIVAASAEESLLRGYDGFGGHLLCRVRDKLVDASLSQANRPEHKIELLPFCVFDAEARFLRGEVSLVAEMNGCEVVYTRIADQSWRNAPDWKHAFRYRSAVNSIIEQAGRITPCPTSPHPSTGSNAPSATPVTT